jgi:hypothetical protein
VIQRLFADIETSLCKGYFWRPGYKVQLSYENVTQDAAIICICWKWQHKARVQKAVWKGPYDDKNVIEEFMPQLLAADEIVAHNGDRFDWPWIRTRCMLHGIDFPARVKTVDTLAIARRLFRFPNNRMDSITKYLGGKGKIPTNFDLWRNVCEGQKKATKYMVDYCKNDVAELQEMWERFEPYYTPKTHAGVAAGRDKWTCPHCASKKVSRHKPRHTAMGTVQHQFQCRECHKYYTISDKSFRDWMEWMIDQDAKKRKGE